MKLLRSRERKGDYDSTTEFGGKGSDGIAKCIIYEASARAIEVY